MKCPNCNITVSEADRFCKSCGHILPEINVSEDNRLSNLIGFIAFGFATLFLFFRVAVKIYITLVGSDTAIWDSVFYMILSSWTDAVNLVLIVLLVVLSKNIKLRTIVIVIASIIFVFEMLANIKVFNWNNFWYYN